MYSCRGQSCERLSCLDVKQINHEGGVHSHLKDCLDLMPKNHCFTQCRGEVHVPWIDLSGFHANDHTYGVVSVNVKK